MHESPTKPRRRWFQYSLRTFFAGMIALTCFIAWWSHRAERQREAVAAIRAAGGRVIYNYQLRPTKTNADLIRVPDWLVSLFGADFFYSVVVVSFVDTHRLDGLSSEKMRTYLRAFPRLTDLAIGQNGVSDADLEVIGHCRELRRLQLSRGWGVTDTGWGCLSHVRRLRSLQLDQVRITRKVGDMLSQLPDLKTLSLENCELSPQGLSAIGEMKNVDTSSLQGSRGIQDDALAYLSGMTELRTLDLIGTTSVTEEGLKNLAAMTQLGTLYLDEPGRVRLEEPGFNPAGSMPIYRFRVVGPWISRTGVQQLRQALPKCGIVTTRR